MNYKPIIIVAGEPNSVFSEIFFKAIKNNNFKRPLILIASEKLISKQMVKLKFNFKINLIDSQNININKLQKKMINLIDVKFEFQKIFDEISDKSNSYITESFKIALRVIKKNNLPGLINGPISKKHFLKEKFLGITEYLSKKTNNKNTVMLIYNEKLSVSPLTTHLPLKDVNKNISKKKIIKHVELLREFYKKKFNKNLKIAITGLNPHCESNYRSSEEDKIIKPAIKSLDKKKIKVYGPFPADTIFMQEQFKKYDVILGMYHDQVLTPLKSLFGFDAINITLGLPFLRVSPDHGPNSLMLGKNLSNPKSLIKALKFLDI